MSSKIASTTFDTDGKDVVATVDVYKVQPTSVPLNRAVTTIEDSVAKSQAAVSSLGAELISKAKDNLTAAFTPKALLDGIIKGNLKDVLTSGLPLNKDDAMQLLLQATGGAVGQINALKDLKGDLLTSLLGSVGFVKDPKALADGILGLPGSTDPATLLLNSNPKLKILNGAVKFIKNDADFNSTEGILSAINVITGDSELAKVVNLQSQFAVLSNLVFKAQISGMPFLIDKVLNKLDDDEKKVFLLDNAHKAMLNGDFYFLGKVMDAVSVEQLASKVKNPATYILANYRLPKGTNSPSEDTMESLGATLIALLDRVEPNWHLVSARNTTLSNLGPFLTASKDAHQVLRNSIYKVPAALATTYKASPLKEIVAVTFPRALLPFTSSSQSA